MDINPNQIEQASTDKKCWGQPEKDCGIKEKKGLFKSFTNKQKNFSLWYFIIALFILYILNYIKPFSPSFQVVEFSEFKKLITQGIIKRVELGKAHYIGYKFFKKDLEIQESSHLPSYLIGYKTVPINDSSFIQFLDSMNVEYYAIPEENNYITNFILNWLFPFIMMVIIWSLIFKRMGKLGTSIMSFGNNQAQLVAEGDIKDRFDDVAGVDEAKEELKEIVDFLKNPEKYTAVGGKIPKGVLLVGPPGTGKTLCARAVAGEAGVPFFKMSGADFVEMFVGVGAARVRDLFRQARQKAPCIIFIDELDAIGKARGTVSIGGHDEREQTLNQLLVEMDGFDSRSGVIILAATNRPEILDPALLRPGRFDRQILIDKPDLKGREEILKRHVRGVVIDSSVNLNDIATRTPGFSGADLANLVNEAALLAVRRNKKEVTHREFEDAIEKIIAGLEKKNRLINPKEKQIVAYHEAGHALIASVTEGADPVKKISIVPRGLGALGYTMQVPIEDRFLMSEKELLGKIDILLGGRGAEEVVLGEISTGAANDLVRATEIARKMITDYGMSEKFRNVVLQTSPVSPFLGDTPSVARREYSEQTQLYIDETVAKIINTRYEIVKSQLTENKELLTKIATSLLEKETLTEEEFKEIINQHFSKKI